jgi:hypothetical protein
MIDVSRMFHTRLREAERGQHMKNSTTIHKPSAIESFWRFISPAMIAIILATSANADPAADLEKMRTNGNQLSEDLITCAAFFMITAQGVENRGTPEDRQSGSQWKNQAARAMMFADTIANSIGQKPEVLAVRVETISQSLMDEMGGNFMNYSLLSSKYLQKCVDLMRDPEQTVARRLSIPAKAEAPNPLGKRQ